MKKIFAFIVFAFYCIAVFCQETLPDSLAVGAGGVVNELIALFINKYNLVIGVVFFLANLGVQNIKWLADRFDAKLLSSLMATVVAIVMVIIEKGAGILDNVAVAIFFAWFLYNLIRGSIDSRKGETIAVKETIVVKDAITEATIAADKAPVK